MLKVITTRSDADADEGPTISTTLDDLARDGARRMIAVALQLEAAEYVTRFREARDEYGHALVVRNGTARPRPVTTGVGPDHRRSPDQRPADARRGPAEVHERDPAALRAAVAARGERPAAALPARAVVGGLPRGVAGLLGPEAAGLSSSAILRLTKSWTAEYEAFRQRDLT